VGQAFGRTGVDHDAFFVLTERSRQVRSLADAASRRLDRFSRVYAFSSWRCTRFCPEYTEPRRGFWPYLAPDLPLKPSVLPDCDSGCCGFNVDQLRNRPLLTRRGDESECFVGADSREILVVARSNLHRSDSHHIRRLVASRGASSVTGFTRPERYRRAPSDAIWRRGESTPRRRTAARQIPGRVARARFV